MRDDEEEAVQQHDATFADYNIDSRLLIAIRDQLSWQKPTVIQGHALPYALSGRDVLVRAQTGCGKTAIFSIPVAQKVLRGKPAQMLPFTSCMILAPSAELCHQIEQHFKTLLSACSSMVSVANLSRRSRLHKQEEHGLESIQGVLTNRPDVVIATPYRLASASTEQLRSITSSIQCLVLDEADLMFSHGYKQDLVRIVNSISASRQQQWSVQTIMTSATLSQDVNQLKSLVLKKPVTIDLQTSALPQAAQLKQYKLCLEEEDKLVFLLALFKFSLIQGRTLIFVKSVDRCYKLKLFLHQFSVAVCVLNSEMPIESRNHILQQFNMGCYSIIIAVDSQEGASIDVNDKRRPDEVSKVARGIDFHAVANVINFDFPPDVDSYVHRVGRTARGNSKGTALSLVSLREADQLATVDAGLIEMFSSNAGGQSVLSDFQFDVAQFDSLRYRVRDAWRACTRIAVRESRLSEIKRELLNCAKLQAVAESSPRDLMALRHDKTKNSVRQQDHLRHVPDYLIPVALRGVVKVSASKSKRKKRRVKLQGAISVEDVSNQKPAVRPNKMSFHKRRFFRKQIDALSQAV